MKKVDKKESILDRIIDLILDKIRLKVILIFIIGFILRIISARNIKFSADDANHAIIPIGIFGSGKLVNWGQSTILWYYIQGVFYKIFGTNTMGSRFASVLFGSLLIIAVFLFTKKIFKSNNVAVFASTLTAFSPLLIKNTLSEMDVTICFFLILGAYYLFNYLENSKRKDIIIMSIILGIATMIKLYALIFVFSFFVFVLIKKRKKINKKQIINLGIFILIIGLMSFPTLVHNYLLYKDKGFMDLIFTNTLKIGVENAAQYYNWGAGWLAHSDYKGFFFGNQRNFNPTPLPGAMVIIGFLFRGDPLLVLFGILGIILVFNKNKDYFWFFIITFLPAFIYLGAQIPMTKHFIWVLVLIAPCGGLFIKNIQDKIKLRTNVILGIILIFSLIYLSFPINVAHPHFYGQSGLNQLIEYKEDIPQNALVVADSRIYRGLIHWSLTGTNYIEASQFFPVVNELNSQGNLQNIEVHYIECVSDDCGWGTIKNQPEFNNTMEQLTQWFANSSQIKKEIYQPKIKEQYFPIIGEREIRYRVYKTTLSLNPAIFLVAKQTHTWFLYPVGFDRSISPIFDDYEILNTWDLIIEKIAWWILYIEIIFAFLFIILVLYLFLKEN